MSCRKGSEYCKGSSWSDTAISHNRRHNESPTRSTSENKTPLQLPSTPPTPYPCSLCRQDKATEITEVLRHQLQVMVCEQEGQQAVTSKQHTELERSTQDHELMLALVGHYARMLILQRKILLRIYELAGNMVTTPLEQISCLNENEEILSAVADKTTTAAAKPNELARLQTEYKTKKDNFLIASHNFHILLNDQNVSEKQLRKLQEQYNTIVLSCQLSRSLLQQEMNRVIQSHRKLLSKCFSELNNSLDQSHLESDMAYMSSFLSKAFFSSPAGAANGDQLPKTNRSLCLLPVEGDGDY